MKKFDIACIEAVLDSAGVERGELERFVLTESLTGFTHALGAHIATSALSSSVRYLKIYGRYEPDVLLGLLSVDGAFGSLEELELSKHDLRGVAQVERLCTWDVLGRLTTLRVVACRIAEEFASSFGEHADTAHLSTLALGGTCMEAGTYTRGSFDFAQILEGCDLAQLRELELNIESEGGQDVLGILASTPSVRLRSLAIKRLEHIVPEGASAYFAAEHARGLQQQHLGRNVAYDGPDVFDEARLAGCLGADELRVLADSGMELESLTLWSQNVDAAAIDALQAAPWYSKLSVLALNYSPLDDAGALAIAHGPAIPEVRVLDLGGSRIGEAGKEALMASESLSESARGRIGRQRFVEPPRTKDALMGELRSLVAREPSRETFGEICKRLDAFAKDQPDVAREEIVPYLNDVLSSWSRAIRSAIVKTGGSTYIEFLGDHAHLSLLGRYVMEPESAPAEHVSLALVKGVHICASGNYGSRKQTIHVDKYIKKPGFCALESVIFNQVDTTEEQEYENDLTGAQFKLALDHMPNLKEAYVVSSVRFTGHDMKIIADSGIPFERLGFVSCYFSPEGGIYLAEAENLGGLKELTLDCCHIKRSGFEALCNSTTLKSLKRLDLGYQTEAGAMKQLLEERRASGEDFALEGTEVIL